MNKFHVFGIGLSLLSACATKIPAPVSNETHELHYEFDLAKCAAKACVHEKFSFVSSQDEEVIKLPKEVIGMKDLFHVIQNLKLTSHSGKLSKTEDEAVYVVKSKPGTEITLECDVVQDFEGDATNNERYYRPMIDSERFHVFGEALFLYPAWDKNKFRKIILDFKLPSGSGVANSFGASEEHQELVTSIELLRQGTYVGGPGVRLNHFDIQGKPVWLAVMGKLNYSDEKMQDVLKRILKTEREFWRDDHFPYYFVSAISVSKNVGGGGQGRTNGFAIFGTEAFDPGWLEHLLAHELFHTWNGHTILKQEREERIYWFSEGFTDYYADILAFRSGLVDFPNTIKEINRIIKRYYFSSKRSAPLDQVEKDFWTSSEVQKLPYQQGFLLAQSWNDEIKKKSKGKLSLDDLMRAMLKEANEHHTVASDESVEKTAETYLKRDVKADIDQWIVTGGTIPVLPTRLTKCASLKETEVEKFNLGFDRDSTVKSKVFTGVDQAGPAYRAGLREGYPMKGIDLYHGDTQRPVTLSFLKEGRVEHVEYLPLGDRVKIPQYVIKARCSPKTM